MKPHPRIRKTVKWGGAVMTVLLVGVWVGSGWYAVGWSGGSGYWIAITGGSVQVQYYPPVYNQPGTLGWHAGSVPAPLLWKYVHVEKAYRWHVVVPLWPLVLLACIPLVLAWRLDTLARRRAAHNLCPACRYSRTGLAPNVPCPECGSAPAHTNP